MIPKDVAVCVGNKRVEFSVDQIPNHPIYDIGTETIKEYARYIRKAKTLFANGPAGVFEQEDFNIGTDDILNAIASSNAFSIIGGGHLAAAANHMGLSKGISHISSGGGASINLLAGEELPVVKVLREHASKNIQTIIVGHVLSRPSSCHGFLILFVVKKNLDRVFDGRVL